jgi:hypothetical protein
MLQEVSCSFILIIQQFGLELRNAVSSAARFLLLFQFVPKAAWIQSAPHWISLIPFSLLWWFLTAVVAITQACIFYQVVMH